MIDATSSRQMLLFMSLPDILRPRLLHGWLQPHPLKYLLHLYLQIFQNSLFLYPLLLLLCLLPPLPHLNFFHLWLLLLMNHLPLCLYLCHLLILLPHQPVLLCLSKKPICNILLKFTDRWSSSTDCTSKRYLLMHSSSTLQCSVLWSALSGLLGLFSISSHRDYSYVSCRGIIATSLEGCYGRRNLCPCLAGYMGSCFSIGRC